VELALHTTSTPAVSYWQSWAVLSDRLTQDKRLLMYSIGGWVWPYNRSGRGVESKNPCPPQEPNPDILARDFNWKIYPDSTNSKDACSYCKRIYDLTSASRLESKWIKIKLPNDRFLMLYYAASSPKSVLRQGGPNGVAVTVDVLMRTAMIIKKDGCSRGCL
jgi:hypothetical protein